MKSPYDCFLKIIPLLCFLKVHGRFHAYTDEKRCGVHDTGNSDLGNIWIDHQFQFLFEHSNKEISLIAHQERVVDALQKAHKRKSLIITQ